MTEAYDSMCSHYQAITQRYQQILDAVADPASCNWNDVGRWSQENDQYMEFIPDIGAETILEEGEIEQLKNIAESLMHLQDTVVSEVRAAKIDCAQGIQQQRSTQKALRAYAQPQDNEPRFQDKTL